MSYNPGGNDPSEYSFPHSLFTSSNHSITLFTDMLIYYIDLINDISYDVITTFMFIGNQT